MRRVHTSDLSDRPHKSRPLPSYGDTHEAFVAADMGDSFTDHFTKIFDALVWRPLADLPEQGSAYGRGDYEAQLAGRTVLDTALRAFDTLAAMVQTYLVAGCRIVFEVEDDLLPILVLLGGATGRRASVVVVGGPVPLAQSADEVPRTGDRIRVFMCLVMDAFVGVFLRIHTRNTVVYGYSVRCSEIFV